MTRPLSRRALLQALTVGAGSVAFGANRNGELSRASAQAAKPPPRIIIFPVANGVTNWTDMVADGPAGTNFTFGEMLAPLDTLGLKGDTVVLDNLEFRRVDQDVDTHFEGIIQALCGNYTPNYMAGKSAGQSVDRYIASKIGGSLPWSQINMGTMCDDVTYSYQADGTGVQSAIDPVSIYNNVFGGLTSTGPDPAVVRRLARRKSVLDTVVSDVNEFTKRLPSEDKARAEAQLASIRAMENRIAAGASMSTACVKPTLQSGVNFKSDQYVPECLRAFSDIAVAAIACDQARVILMHSYIREYHPPQFLCPWMPANQPNTSFHGLSHDDPGDNFESFRRARAFHYQLAGELANKLKAIPEAGGTMLDNTIIFMPSEIGWAHTGAGLQFITIGGKNQGVKTGQVLRLGKSRSVNNGLPNQRMLVSLINFMGLPDTTFNEENGSGSGPVPGFFA